MKKKKKTNYPVNAKGVAGSPHSHPRGWPTTPDQPSLVKATSVAPTPKGQMKKKKKKMIALAFGNGQTTPKGNKNGFCHPLKANTIYIFHLALGGDRTIPKGYRVWPKLQSPLYWPIWGGRPPSVGKNGLLQKWGDLATPMARMEMAIFFFFKKKNYNYF
jgi:hypothetical protein